MPLIHDQPLATFNTFRIPARARHYLRVDGAEQLAAVRADPALAALPRLVLGGGSNLLFTRDVDGLVLHMTGQGREVLGEEDGKILVRAQAGEHWHGFVRFTLEQGIGGLENLSLIPGTVGAAPIQNVGAYGVETKDVFHSLTAYDMASGATRTLDAAACRFGYRDSIFKHPDGASLVVLDVTFALPRAWQPNLRYAELGNAVQEAGLTAPTPQRHRPAGRSDPAPQAARSARDRQCRQLLQESGGVERGMRAPAGAVSDPGAPRPAGRHVQAGGRLADRPVRLERPPPGRGRRVPRSRRWCWSIWAGRRARTWSGWPQRSRPMSRRAMA